MRKASVLLTATILMSSMLCWGTANANSHDSAPQEITLFENTKFYRSPNAHSEPIATLTPQTVQVVGTEPGWIMKDNPWFYINTWLGEAWIQPNLAYSGEELPLNKKIALTGDEDLYDYPLSGYKNGGTISPQTVDAISSMGPWLKIKSWLGDKWINPRHMVVYDVHPNQGSLDLKGITPIFALPKADSNVVGELSPLQLAYFESAGNWYHVNTWMGTHWVNPKISLPINKAESNKTIALTAAARIYKYPSHEAEMLGMLAPQDITVFEQVDGWYHIHTTWVGDGWIYPDVDPQTYMPPTFFPTVQLMGEWEYHQFDPGTRVNNYPIDPYISIGGQNTTGNGFKLGTPIKLSLMLINLSDSSLTIQSPMIAEIEIYRLTVDGKQLVWSGQIPPLSAVIPGKWGAEEITFQPWNQKDADGKQVAPGDYSVQLKSPLNITYTTDGKEASETYKAGGRELEVNHFTIE